MPQFAPGVAKTAIAPIVAKPSGMNCEAELFLGPDDSTKVVSSGRVPFVSTGVAKNVNLPITMPGAPGSYHGYIDVFAEGLRFLAYKLTEDVVIAAPPFNISGSGVGYVCPIATSWWYPDLTFTINNPNSIAVTHTMQLWRRSISLAGYPEELPSAITTPALGGVDNVRVVSPGQVSPIQITIQPGGSYIYRYTGAFMSNYPIPDYIGYYTLLARPRSFFFWLQDELGNKSPEVNIVRS